MDTPTMFLCTFLLVMIVSSVTALSPMAQSMNAEIMSDYMDLQRKVMRYRMFQSSMGGPNGGNTVLPAGIQNLLASFGGMVPSEMSSVQTSVNSGSQTGNFMPEVAPTLQNIGLKNPQPATKTANAKTSSKKSSLKSKSGKVTHPSNAAQTPKQSSSKQTPVTDMVSNVPTAIGSTMEQNPMIGLEMAALMNAGSMMNTAGGSMFDQGQTSNPSNPTLKGVPQMASSGMNNGQAGMSLPQANLGQMLIQHNLCSETPSKLRQMCMTNKDCSHKMQCFTGRCCAKNLDHAEILDNMVEHLERQRARQAWMRL